MKGIVNFALAATLVAGVSSSQSHQHQHRHHHAKKNVGSPVEKRAPEIVTSYVQGPTVTQYELDGKVVDAEAAKEGIQDGLYSIVGETTPTFTPPAPPKVTTTSSSSSSSAAVFFEQKSTSAAPQAQASAAAQAASNSGSSSGAKGIDAEFPNGEISCDALPTEYGAVSLPWIGLSGWASIQSTDEWIPGVKISTIHQPISGGCRKSSFCSYACPAGYEKAQWPESSQGATGQSIGGLWCNAQGKLELTRPEFKTLCMPGAGGVFVENQLSAQACVCRTNYPGDEKMSIATVTEPGGTYTLTNPDAKKGYWWQGSPTSAQYYVNNLGVGVEDACTWNSPKFPLSAGNWSPTNIGVGKDIHGITYISIFKNAPTSTAVLDFDIEITGDISAPCALKRGVYTGGGNGCTTAISGSGKATIVFKPSS